MKYATYAVTIIFKFCNTEMMKMIIIIIIIRYYILLLYK